MIHWAERAIADLVEIGDYIAEDNPEAARSWIERLRTKAESAAEAPLVGRRVPEIARDDIRETYLRSYRIVYRVNVDGITVLAVFEGRRRMGHVDLDPDG